MDVEQLNELANMPGYGRSQNIVKNKGYWREEYTFDDVVDRLEDKDVLIFREDDVLCKHNDYEYADSLESQLRKAMEA